MIDLQTAIIIFTLTGLASGVLSALYGIGGGIIIVPLLYRYLLTLQLPHGIEMHSAVATSLLAMLVITANSIYWHYKKGNILLAEVHKMLPWIAIGAFIGGLLSSRIGGVILHELFVSVLLAGILFQVLRQDFFKTHVLEEFIHPTLKHNIVVCTVIGIISVMIGIGGSIMTLPYLRKARMPMINASAVSVALVPTVSLLGTLGYIFTASAYTFNLPGAFWGFIYLPAFIAISVGAVLGAPVGVKLCQTLSDSVLATSYFLLLIVLLIISMQL